MLMTINHEPGSRVVKIDVTNEGAKNLRFNGNRLGSIGWPAQQEWAIQLGESLGFNLRRGEAVENKTRPEVLYIQGKKGIANRGFVIALWLEKEGE